MPEYSDPEAGYKCTDYRYCQKYYTDEEGCILTNDTYGNEFIDCPALQHGDAYFPDIDYTVEYWGDNEGYYFSDSNDEEWYETFDGKAGYYRDNTNDYSEVWILDDSDNYLWRTSSDDFKLKSNEGNVYYFYSSGSIYYHDNIDNVQYYYFPD